eukprot:tig00021612_g22893.t1
MSLHVMPLLIINLGGEMMYILEQRLRAQAIPPEKSRKVLEDVIRTMYNKKFIEELYKPQEMYSNASARQIFDRLAHSSIMRLSESSMDKLYDLMTMGFKYQLASVSHAGELLQVTLNHLDALKAMVSNNPSVSDMVDAVYLLTVQKYGSMSAGELLLVRQTACRFFQDKRVKVSLFLQDGIQAPDGTVVLPVGGPMPPGAEPPGTVRYFDGEEQEVRRATVRNPSASGCLPFDGAKISSLGVNLCAPPPPPPLSPRSPTSPPSLSLAPPIAPALPSPSLRPLPLRPSPTIGPCPPSPPPSIRPCPPAPPPPPPPPPLPPPPPPPNTTRRGSPPQRPAQTGAKKNIDATAELNLLARLIAPSAADASTFKINLFSDGAFGIGSSGGGAGSVSGGDVGPAVPQVSIDGQKGRKGLNDMMRALDIDSKGAKASSGGDDLLELMDSAG